MIKNLKQNKKSLRNFSHRKTEIITVLITGVLEEKFYYTHVKYYPEASHGDYASRDDMEKLLKLINQVNIYNTYSKSSLGQHFLKPFSAHILLPSLSTALLEPYGPVPSILQTVPEADT